jgi:hypothetical protein
MKDFIKEFAANMGMDTSDLMRMIVEYYFFCFFTGQGSYKQIREKFFSITENPQKKVLK